MLLNFVFVCLLPLSALGSISFLLFLVLRPLFHTTSAQLKKDFLSLISLVFLLPVLLGGILWFRQMPATQNNQAAPPIANSTAAYHMGETIAQTLHSTVLPEAGPQPSISNQSPSLLLNKIAGSIAAIWLLGSAIFAAIYALRYLHFTRALRRRAAHITHPAVYIQYKGLCSKMNIAHAPLLTECDGIGTPLLFGVLRPQIVLPRSEARGEILQFALQHELTHFRHHDVIIKLLMQGIVALHWWNPLAWQLRRTMNETAEEVCDETVVQTLELPLRKQYAHALIDFAAPPLPYAAGFGTNAAKLKRRLTTMLQPKHINRRIRMILLTLLSLAVLACFAAGCAMTNGAAEASAEEKNIAAVQVNHTEETQENAPAESTPAESAPAESNAESSAPTEMEAMIYPVAQPYTLGRAFESGTHRGLDFEAEQGTEIYAATSGEVLVAEEHVSYGNYILIKHADRLYTLYAHCDTLKVTPGQTVKRGDWIATVGTTGNSFGNHLHFEIWNTEHALDMSQYGTESFTKGVTIVDPSTMLPPA